MNAVNEDIGSGSTVIPNYQGSWDTFAADNSINGGIPINDSNVGNYLGSWGVDTATHTVWAVVDHNSEFAVVPEPASMSLLLLGGLLGLKRRRK